MKHAWLAGTVSILSCLAGSMAMGQEMGSRPTSDKPTTKSVEQGESAVTRTHQS
jgi:hypothetical protein